MHLYHLSLVQAVQKKRRKKIKMMRFKPITNLVTILLHRLLVLVGLVVTRPSQLPLHWLASWVQIGYTSTKIKYGLNKVGWRERYLLKNNLFLPFNLILLPLLIQLSFPHDSCCIQFDWNIVVLMKLEGGQHFQNSAFV